MDALAARRRFVLAAVVLGWLLLTALDASAGQTFQQDFRRGQPLHPHFGTLGPRDPASMQEESGGLRLEVPKNGPFRPAGIVLRLKLQGDFELDVTYVVQSVGGDEAVLGVGAAFPAARKSGAFAIPLAADAELAAASAKGKAAPKAPRPATLERVRLVRRGENLTLQHGPANGSPLSDVETHTDLIGDAEAMSFGLYSASTPAKIQVQTFSVVAVGMEGVRVARKPQPRSYSWLWGTIAAAAGMAYLWRRRALARAALPTSMR